jgi:hypothetical protein
MNKLIIQIDCCYIEADILEYTHERLRHPSTFGVLLFFDSIGVLTFFEKEILSDLGFSEWT